MKDPIKNFIEAGVIKSTGLNKNEKKAQEALRTPKRFAKRYWIFAERFGVRKASCAF